MTFERRSTFLGIPFSKWTSVPEGKTEDRFDGAEPYLGMRQGRVLSVKVETNVPPDEAKLEVSTRTIIADSWTTFREVPSHHILPKGDLKRVRVFTATPGHQIVYRWNGQK